MSLKTYPLLLHNLEQRLCVVVGGGTVATRKVTGLVDAGAKPRVISPEISVGLEELKRSGNIDHIARDYQWGDLQSVFLAFSCSNNSEVNKLVLDEAKDRNIFINHTEDATDSDFSTPATIRQGSLLLTVSSEGKSPSLVRHIKESLEETYDKRYGLLTDLLAEVRGNLKELSSGEREQLMSELISESYLNQLILNMQAAQEELNLLLKKKAI